MVVFHRDIEQYCPNGLLNRTTALFVENASTEITARSLPAIVTLAIERAILRIIESPLAATDHALTPCATAVELHADPPWVAFVLRHLTSPFGARLPYGQGAFGRGLKTLKAILRWRPSHPFQEGRRWSGFDAERSKAFQ
jgi:hypothetical protein